MPRREPLPRAACEQVDTLPQLKRGLGSPALFGIVQGFVAASIYFSVGVVAARALGLTWLVYLAGALFFALIVPCYVEGTSLHQERGGATVIARYAFNELWSFVAGWAICLDYLILIALDRVRDHGLRGRVLGAVRLRRAGVPAGGRRRRVRGACCTCAGARRGATSARRCSCSPTCSCSCWSSRSGSRCVFEPDVLTDPAQRRPARRRWATCCSPSRSCSSRSPASTPPPASPGRWRSGGAGCKRLMTVRFAGGGRALRRDRAGRLERAAAAARRATGSRRRWSASRTRSTQAWLREPLRYALAVAGIVILVAACNAAMLGLSRLGYALAVNRQIPSLIGYLHPTRSTPVVVIVDRRAAGDRAAAAGRPRLPRRHLRLRRDDRLHDRAPSA